MPEFRTSPGMRDILAPESLRWRRFVDEFAAVVESSNYSYMVPPMLEDLGVFTRIGEATELVVKEMYDFVDKGDRHVALRPEFTAGVCRAYVEHRPPTPWKVWYAGPNFRYERPQRGRYRQFDQVGIEVLGVDDPDLDVEVIALGWGFLQRLGLRRVRLLVNSLGEPADREAYVEALGAYFSDRVSSLSAPSQATLLRNPLRVLDSKRPEDAEIIAGAPSIEEFWSAAARSHHARVRSGLDALGIDVVDERRLVRGLDYYRRTTFEFVGETLESAQNALGGGGRYDGLVRDLGGPDTPGIGFAIGVDRTLLACDDEGVFPAPSPAIDVFVVDTAGRGDAVVIAAELRAAGLRVDQAYDGRSMKSQMKAADRSGAMVAVIIGPDEADAASAVVRPLRSTAEQELVERRRLAAHLADMVRDHLPGRPT